MKHRQHGFSAIEAAIIIVVLSVIGLTGWFVIHGRNNATASSDAASNVSKTSAVSNKTVVEPAMTVEPPQNSNQLLSIKEWGLRVSLDETTASMEYVVSPTNPNVAYFSLKTISDIAPNCAANKISLAAIGRLNEAEQRDALANPSDTNIAGTIRIDNYWYSIEKSHVSCTDNADQDATIGRALPDYTTARLLKVLHTLAAE